MTQLPSDEVTNWGGTIRSFPARIVRPLDATDVQRVVRDTVRFPSPVRAVGSNHSTTECGTANGGTLIEMTSMSQFRIDEATMTVRAQAGAIYVDVAQELSRHGYQLYVNPEIGNLSIGSACCGGTKDASMPGELPQVSSYCVEMTVVEATGELCTINEKDAPERMQLMRSSYGLMGIVVEAVFRIKKLQPMRFYHEVYSTAEFRANLPSLYERPASMMMYILPFLDRVVVELREDGEGSELARRDRMKWWFRNLVWKLLAPAAGRTITALVPIRSLRYALIDRFNQVVVWFLRTALSGVASDPSDQVIRYPHKGGIGMYTFSIWAFPEATFAETFTAYVEFCRRYYREHGYRCNMLNVGYHFAKDQSSLFSYSYDSDMWSLDVVSTGDRGWEVFVRAYNAFCSEHGGKPLFNQTRSITPAQVYRAFGADKLQRFLTEREKVDPAGRFVNQYFSWLLSIRTPPV